SDRPTVRLSDQEQRRGSVIDATRAAGRDGAVFPEGRFEGSEFLGAAVRSRVLVLGEMRAVGQGDRDDLVRENAILLCFRGAALPARKTSRAPARVACAALATAWSAGPHSRLTVCPGTSTGSPASSAAIRATLRLSSPAWLAHPKITSSMVLGSIPVLSTTAL